MARSVRAALALMLVGCGGVASPELGLGDLLYVDGAQFRPGAFPSANGGPAVLADQTAHQTIVIGTNREVVSGTLAPDARAVLLGIPTARGAWIVPAGPPAFDTPGEPSLRATFGLGAALGPGPFELDVAAVDEAGHIGDALPIPLMAADAAPPTGDLVVSLEWTSTADLDLHVVDPTGGEAWSGHPNTWQIPPPGTPVDPCAWAAGGILDHDANVNCARDATPNEHVIWTTRSCSGQMIAPVLPSGTYTVRVDARSLCSDASAAWAASVYSEGTLVGAARGIAVPDDVAYEPHGAGAGITALQFTLP